MQQRESTFKGSKGATLHYQSWLPAKPRAAVVVAHGLGEHGGRYAAVAERLAGIGCAAYAIDHRGHGRSSGGPSAYIERLALAVADFDRLVDLALREQRQRPVFVLGHSMGALIGLSHAIKHRGKLAGLVVSAPALVLGGASAWSAALVKLVAGFAPKRGLRSLDPALLTRDETARAGYVADPLVCHAKLPARTVAEIIKFGEIAPALLPALDLPLLALHGSDDALASPAGSEQLMQLAGSRDKTLKRYEGLRHKLFDELPADRERVLADLLAWLEPRIDSAARRAH